MLGDTGEEVITSGKVFPVLGIFGQMKRRGMLHVRYDRDMWRTNGPRIRIRLVVLSNFHVQSFSIRATVYFLLILKGFNHLLELT